MPIVNNRREKGKLSPLEEEPQGGGARVTMERGRHSSVEDRGGGGGVSVFTTIGTLILTSRPYDSLTKRYPSDEVCPSPSSAIVDSHRASLQGEIFQSVNKESLLTMQEQMEKLWSGRIPMCIEVKGQATPITNDSSVLLEQWLVQVLPRRSHTPPIPPSFLTHAVQSFLHFSQIRSWIVSHKGSLPFDLTYRVCAPGEDTSDQFSPHTPKLHTFPPSPLSPLSSVQISVCHLPRLKHVPPSLSPQCSDIIERFRDLSLSKSAERLKDISLLKFTDHLREDPSSFSKSAECLKDLMHSTTSSGERYTTVALSKSAERFRDLSCSKSSPHSMSVSNSSRLITPPHLIRHPPTTTTTIAVTPHSSHPPTSHSPHSSRSHSSTPHTCHTSHPHSSHMAQETFPFSPPQPSPMSPKLLAGLGEQPLQYHSLLDGVLLDKIGSRGNQSNHDNCGNLGNMRGRESSLETSDSCSECGCLDNDGKLKTSVGHSCIGSFCFESGCVGEGERGGGREGVRREGDGVQRRRRRKEERVVTSGAVRSPAASSPIPFMRRCASESKNKHIASTVRRSSAINIKGARPPRLLRCNSAPATMPSLCLLGTFEESVLNGRLEPCGFVEGFTAELGASGSFCPRHITFPVTAAFFNLSVSGTSPYLGVIDLSTTGKRGYHIPKKGTVQLTLFNPNGTVIKIFVVTYDLSDMPPNSQTFLRQKIISHSPAPSYHPHTLTPRTLSLHSPPLLHYLIHLRFLCSTSGRVYLHRDIRLIFARRAPDTEPDFSRVTLVTVMEAPPSPKYGPLDGQSGK